MEPDDQYAWDGFASAWLTRVEPPKHGDNEEVVAKRTCTTAAKVADLMMLLRSNPQLRGAQPTAIQRGISSRTRAIVAEALGEEPEANGAGNPHAISPGQEGFPCQRAFNNHRRGDENGAHDCPGHFDNQGLCSTCRLPAATAVEMPRNQPGAE